MKKIFLLALMLTVPGIATLRADQVKTLAQQQTNKVSYDPVPVVNAPMTVAAPSFTATGPKYVYDQRVITDNAQLISADQAQAIVGEFRTNYPKLGSPRMLIYVNRELVDEKSGLKIKDRTEKVVSTHADAEGKDSGSIKATTKNSYEQNGKSEPTLADRQTVRDIERLMGRPLRSAGVTLVDQRVASHLISGLAPGALGTDTEEARKDREAAMKNADVAIEVLISSKDVTVTEISGDKTYSVPDIQMTAIRLKDAAILGQATASDVINKSGGPAVAARRFTVQDITETTTLALMDDISQSVK